jgi:hypothetical protein
MKRPIRWSLSAILKGKICNAVKHISSAISLLQVVIVAECTGPHKQKAVGHSYIAYCQKS